MNEITWKTILLFSVEVIDPGVLSRALLGAGGELPLVGLEGETALVLLAATPVGAVGEVAVEDGGRVNIGERLGVSGPGNEFLGGDEVDIRESQDGVDELEETVLTVITVEEPSSVEEEREGCLALGVVLKEILCEDFLD